MDIQRELAKMLDKTLKNLSRKVQSYGVSPFIYAKTSIAHNIIFTFYKTEFEGYAYIITYQMEYGYNATYGEQSDASTYISDASAYISDASIHIHESNIEYTSTDVLSEISDIVMNEYDEILKAAKQAAKNIQKTNEEKTKMAQEKLEKLKEFCFSKNIQEAEVE